MTLLLYGGYTVANFTFLALILLAPGLSVVSDRITLIISACGATSGLAQSVLNSIVLNKSGIHSGISVFSHFGLLGVATVNLVLVALACMGLSVVGLFLFNIFPSVFGGKAPSLFILTLLSLLMGFHSLAQSYFQREVQLKYFYSIFLFVTLITMIPFILARYTGSSLIEAEVMEIVLLRYVLSIISFVTLGLIYRRCLFFISIPWEDAVVVIKKIWLLLLTGLGTKSMPPLDRVILAMLGDGLASVFHFSGAILQVVSKFFDSNVLYPDYLSEGKVYKIVRKYLVHIQVVVFVTWFFLILSLFLYFRLDVLMSTDVKQWLYISIILAFLMSIPAALGTLLNSVLIQPLFESGRHSLVAKISLISVTIATLLKVFILSIESEWLIVYFLGISFIIMNAISTYFVRKNC